MYGDTTTIRLLAGQLRDQGEELRDLAASLVAHAREAPWQGHAAEAMRSGVATHSAELRHVADLYNDAGAALARHAEAVDQVLALVAAVETAVHHLVAAARARIASVLGILGAVVDPVDHLLDRFRPPLTGSLDWLDVDLPGLPCSAALSDLRVTS